jgi:hypothetical protein
MHQLELPKNRSKANIDIKTKNNDVRKAAVLDVLTNLPFAIYVPENISKESLTLEKEYLTK